MLPTTQEKKQSEFSIPLQGFQTSVLEPDQEPSPDSWTTNVRFRAILIAADLSADEVICKTCSLSFTTPQSLSEHYAETSHGHPRKEASKRETVKAPIFK